jgi:mxaA protein
MRNACFAFMLMATLPASAEEASVRIHSVRPFGYFVGDLIHAQIDITASGDAMLSRASLPKPGPLTVSLDLRDVTLREMADGGKRGWRLALIYQSFFVALDVREIEIPGFALALSTPSGPQTVMVPSWTISVAPLREIAPRKQERVEDYLRPDGAAMFLDEAAPRNRAMGLGVAALAAFIVVARDRAWPPFQKRRARIFSALAREFVSRRDTPDGETIDATIQSVHRAMDAANGAVLLAGGLPDFFRKHPEFAPLRNDFEQFFSASNRRFFCGEKSADGFGAERLARFIRALAARERAG